MLQSYVLEAHKPHSLESLAERHLGRSGLSYEDVCGKGAHQIPFAQVDVAARGRVLGRRQRDDAARAPGAVAAARGRAGPALRLREDRDADQRACSARIERHGVLIDAAVLAQQSRELAERMVALEHEAHALAGQPFNLGSPKQIGEILFGKLGLPVKKKTASGAPSHRRRGAGRSWRPTTRCRPSCWSTAAWPS